MIEFVKGNMFEYPGLDILVNTVNCVGVMGKGIALEFKRRFPSYFESYKKACNEKQLFPGGCWVSNTGLEKPNMIISFATKNHWRDPSRIEWIEFGLIQLELCLTCGDVFKDKTIGLPALGCNNGGLSWEDVKPLIEQGLGDIPNRVVVFEPLEGTYEQVIHTNKGVTETSKHTP